MSSPAPSLRPRRRKLRRHPWDEWTDGSSHYLYRGFDFDSPVDEFRNRMFTVAKQRRERGEPRGFVITHKLVMPIEECPHEVVVALRPALKVEVLQIQFVSEPARAVER